MLAMNSCCSIKKTQTLNNEVITKTEYVEIVKDTTIYVEIEKEVIKEIIQQPKDTVSVLSTKYATSTAKINNNTLYHTLTNKDEKIPARIQYRDKIQIDSVILTKEIPVYIEIEKPYIPKWCWIIMCYAALTAGITIMRIKKYFI